MPKIRFQPDIPKVKTSIAQREFFRETMAREFERQADHLETLYAGWIEKGFHSGTFEQCLRISLKVEALNDLANQLRRGYYARLESESYHASYGSGIAPAPQDINKES